MSQPIYLVVGTNRPNSASKSFARYYQGYLQGLQQHAEILDLADLPKDFAFSALYKNSGKNEVFNTFQTRIDAAEKFIFIVPEYNHSFPGVLKTFLDGLRYPDTFHGKKVALVGLSAGVIGNAVGLSHLNDILSYMGADVLGLRLKLGQFYLHFTENTLTNPVYHQFLEKQAAQFIRW